jgi:hypothetical protein
MLLGFLNRDQFSSMEGFSNEAVIRFRDGSVHWDGLVMPLLRDARVSNQVCPHRPAAA